MNRLRAWQRKTDRKLVRNDEPGILSRKRAKNNKGAPLGHRMRHH
jgi:hypothetical protein